MQARKHGWQLQVVPKVNFDDGIEAMRYMLPRVRIDKLNCAQAIRALREYQRVWKEDTACFSKKPLDNWAVHIADSFRYLAVNYKRLYDIPQKTSQYLTNL
jgi:predicted dehydrogenase